jgi:hypothetical protein
MPAESISAAHSVLTEISANPVSKSSLAERLHHPTPTQKRPCADWARHIRQKLVEAKSVEGQIRSCGAVLSTAPRRNVWQIAFGFSTMPSNLRAAIAMCFSVLLAIVTVYESS